MTLFSTNGSHLHVYSAPDAHGTLVATLRQALHLQKAILLHQCASCW